MKNIFVLLTVFQLITACSNDDEVNDNGEKIIGSWVLVNWNIPNIPGSEFEEEPTTCNLDSNITFNADHTAMSEFYNNNEEGDCVLDSQSGDWEYHGDREYTIQVPGVGEQRGTVAFEGNDEFTFTLSIGSMTFVRQ